MATHDYPATSSNDISGTPSAGNYARWADADTLEARSVAQVLSDIGAQQAYVVTGTIAGAVTGVKITTALPTTDGQYIFEFILNRGAGYSYVRKTVQIGISGGVFNGALYGDSFGTGHPDCELWADDDTGFLVFYINVSVSGGVTAVVTTTIYTSVSLTAAVLSGWTYTNGTGAWPALKSTESHTLLLSIIQSTKLDDLTAPDDNTDLNASSTRHGLLPKLSNVVTEFLTGQGTWATPAGGFSDFCAAYKNASQTITAQTWTAVSWPAETVDSGTVHDNATNNSRITIATTGKYLIHADMVRLSVNTDALLKIYVNGSVVNTAGTGNNYGYLAPHITALLSLTAGDYVQVYIWTALGADINYEVSTTGVNVYQHSVPHIICARVG